MKCSSFTLVILFALAISVTPSGQQPTDQVTYMGKDGVQYVVVAAGGGTAIGGGLPTSDSLVAFKLGTSASQ